VTVPHTPGPWTIEHRQAELIEIHAATGEIADVWSEDSESPVTMEDWANAHLIAAAPELLDALTKICAQAESWHKETGHEDQTPMVQCDSICALIPEMQSAIRKATKGQ
jgi:hypothetical protein